MPSYELEINVSVCAYTQFSPGDECDLKFKLLGCVCNGGVCNEGWILQLWSQPLILEVLWPVAVVMVVLPCHH